LSEGARANPYGTEAVYELEVGTSGERMPVRSASPSGEATSFYWEAIEQEENRLYYSTLLAAPEPWLWSMLFAPARQSFPFEVSDLASVGEPACLEVWLQGASDFNASPDHHVRLYVNGGLVGETSWDGKLPHALEAEVWLQEGTNQLEIENVGDTEASYSMVLLDRFRVTYPRLPRGMDGRLEGQWSESGTAELAGLSWGSVVLDTSGEEPVWLSDLQSAGDGLRFRVESGRSYLAVGPVGVLTPEIRKPHKSYLERTTHQAEYLMIGPASFLSTADALLKQRREQGLSAKAVALEAVFSEFGFGEPTPQAIQDFLAYAYHNWQVPPRYVVLLGDATYDFKDWLGTGVVNHVPPFMVGTAYLETASDPAYAAVNGDDGLPDLAIGRLPAASVEELQAMVEKILAYENAKRPVDGRIVLVADNPDQAGDFVGNAEELATSVLSNKTLEKIYLSDLGSSETRASVLNAFDEGASLMSYIGHGAIHLWADENILNKDDVPNLSLQSEQPFLLTMNCLNGYFHFPYFDSLSEALLKANGKGAVAAFSPSGMSLNEPAHVYHKALLDELVSGQHHRLGDAVLAAQDAYAASGAFPELLRIYHLLGDPALKIQ
jgi:hypothetical protein